jgi:Trm5-related predicted tRNA methylase
MGATRLDRACTAPRALNSMCVIELNLASVLYAANPQGINYFHFSFSITTNKNVPELKKLTSNIHMLSMQQDEWTLRQPHHPAIILDINVIERGPGG